MLRSRRWASVLAGTGSRYSCRRGRISKCFASGAPGGVSQGPVLLECEGVGASPWRSRPQREVIGVRYVGV